MLRNLSSSVLGLLIAVSGCARHPIPSVVLTPQARIGPAEDYGLSIADVTARDIDFTLEKPAYVIALQVTEDGQVSLVTPLDGTPQSKGGTHYLRAGAARSTDVTWVERSYWTPAFPMALPCTGPADKRTSLGFEGCVDEYTGVPVVQHTIRLPVYRGGMASMGYWVLITSDSPIPARDIRKRLEVLDRSDTSLVNFVRGLPAQVIASRTGRWSAAYAPFGDALKP